MIGAPRGRTDYTDPHTGNTATWEYATWTSPRPPVRGPGDRGHRVLERATPRQAPGSRSSCSGRYSDGTDTPWYVMGRWAAGDGDIRRTSVDDQTDGRSSIWTDTFSVDDAASGLRLVSYQLRLTLYRTPGQQPHPDRVAARRDGLGHPRPLHRPEPQRPRPRPGAAGAALLAERARRASTRSTTTAARRGAAPPPRR